jgi:Tfp pilus assembly protein PilO|tara:strand:+ start:223 stop:828 length:606 start_codon:yes stop_codon:yes gene_type:complete
MPVDLSKTTKRKISENMIVNISVIGGSFLFVIILWILLIHPKVTAVKDLKQKIASVSALDEREIASLAKEKDVLLKKKNKVDNKLIIAKKKLSEEKDIPTLLDKFILTAQKRKLEFTYIKPLDKKDKILEDEGVRMHIKEIPISLEMEAGFAEFLGFLWEAEHSGEIFRITNLTIEKNPKNPIRHRERITLSIYHLIEEEK